MQNKTEETTEQRIQRLEQECKEIMQRVKEHNDVNSFDFRQLKEAYNQKKLEIRYLKSQR